MLEYLRNAAEKPVAKFLIALLAFSFVGWGVAEWIFGNVATDTTLVHVGKGEVTMQQYNLEKNRELAQMTRDEQRAFYTDPVVKEAVEGRILATLTTQRMAENRAGDLGFAVSDVRIAREIREFPEFQQGGQFSAFLFDTVLNESGYTEAQFADVLRKQVLRSMVLGMVSVPTQVPEFVATATYNARNAKRDIEYAVVEFKDFATVNPTDEQLKSYYAQNPQVIPETRTVSYVLVEADMDKPDAYDAGREIAIKVEDDIIAGETLADTAKKHGAKFVELKSISAENRPTDEILTDRMMEQLFNMDEGLESELLEVKQGFVIARVDSVVPEHTAEFEKVKQGLVAGWKKAEQKKQAYVRANEILVAANDGEAIGGKRVQVTRISGAPAQVLSAAFNNAVGTNTIVPDTDAFYVLMVRNHAQPEVDAGQVAKLRQEMEQGAERTLQDDYNSFLNREYPVKVNEKVYNRFFAN
ncbi:MAG: SurA N-terminal domain-containing protein [Alphaproteobacteria bacterium]|nr:SurA N-terminal domain-containing protein [Alphaproteobacteria bacterium]